jgi:hypothetical protein
MAASLLYLPEKEQSKPFALLEMTTGNASFRIRLADVYIQRFPEQARKGARLWYIRREFVKKGYCR